MAASFLSRREKIARSNMTYEQDYRAGRAVGPFECDRPRFELPKSMNDSSRIDVELLWDFSRRRRIGTRGEAARRRTVSGRAWRVVVRLRRGERRHGRRRSRNIR